MHQLIVTLISAFVIKKYLVDDICKKYFTSEEPFFIFKKRVMALIIITKLFLLTNT